MQLVFSTHALRRMLRYGIKSAEVRQALETGERVEEYLDDTPLPSYLVLGKAGRVLHICAADDPTTGETIVITLYEPDPAKWESDFKTRRKP